MSLFGQIKKHQTGISPGLPCIPWTCLIAFHYCIFVQQTPLVLVTRKIFDRLWQNVHPTLHEIVSYDRGSDRFPQVPRQRQLFRGNGHQGAIQRILAVIGWPVSGALDNFQVDRSTRTWDGDSFQGESNSKWEERCMKLQICSLKITPHFQFIHLTQPQVANHWEMSSRETGNT